MFKKNCFFGSCIVWDFFVSQFEDIVPSDTFYKIVSADFKVILFFYFLFTGFNTRHEVARHRV
jgi:hypothetical protein